jgi:hypothetical protein
MKKGPDGIYIQLHSIFFCFVDNTNFVNFVENFRVRGKFYQKTKRASRTLLEILIRNAEQGHFEF